MEHTPTPWVANGNVIKGINGGFLIATTGGDYYDNGRKDKSGASYPLDTEANAAHIVRCVNSHEALFRELCNARDALADLNQSENDEGELLERIDAALKSATGE